jgi:hypothetical protein
MKTNPLFTLTLVLIVLTSILSCTKTEEIDKLPPITMEGKNTLGFLLDGKVWVPYQESSGIFTPTLFAVFDQITNKLSIEARLKMNSQSDGQLNITVHLSNIGIYNVPSDATITFLNDTFFTCEEYECNSNDCTLNISRFDENSRIVSGTFCLKKMINLCGDTIQINDGRFDVKY